MSCHQLPLARRERHAVAAGRDLVEGQSVQRKTMPTVPSREAAACPNQQQPVPIRLASAMAESAPAAAHFVALPLSPPDLPQERLVLQPPACRVAIKWYCGREGILTPPAGCAAARLFSRTIDAAHSWGTSPEVVPGWLAQAWYIKLLWAISKDTCELPAEGPA